MLHGVRTVYNLQLSILKLNQDQVSHLKHLKGVIAVSFKYGRKPEMVVGQDNWNLIITS